MGVGAVVLVRSGAALPGTAVAGVDVSGADRMAVRAVVAELAAARTTGTLLVRALEVEAELDRGLVEVDVEASVELVLSAGRSGPIGIVLGPLLGRGDADVELVIDVDEPALRTTVEALSEQVDQDSSSGDITVEGGEVIPIGPDVGRTLERDDAVDLAEDALRSGRTEPLALPVTEQNPPTTAADVERVANQARASLGGPYALTRAGQSLRVTPAEISPLLSARLVDGELRLAVDVPQLNELVAQKAERIDRPAGDAGFTVAGAAPVVADKGDLTWTPRPAEIRVRPGRTGLAVDVDPATARLTELILAAERTVQRELPVTTTQPELTTDAAEQARVRTLIGTFTTYFQAGQPRARNIRRIAELVDGSYVAAGETFSLNGAAGRRTEARGFVADGAIVDGELTDEVGGGVSQFATTLFNAAFFAGLPIPEHKPHSFYISRYPAGRESTVYFGAIDVKIDNDTANGLLVETSSTPGSVTVALYGDNGGRRVTATHGPRRPRDEGGFRIAVTRSISGGDGVGERRVFNTTYVEPPEED